MTRERGRAPDAGSLRSLGAVGGAALLLAACGLPTTSPCGEEPREVVVPGLSGLLEDRPVLEVQRRAPTGGEECALLDTAWLAFDEDTFALSIEPPPMAGLLDRRVIRGSTDERVIEFAGRNLQVLLDYPDDQLGPEVRFDFVVGPESVAAALCAADGGLACTVEAP
ncbi:MAG: hypothetical protein ACFCGT_21520 [Sandaracinaceae bacterium]